VEDVKVADVLIHVVPQFASLSYPDPAYASLAATCATEISGGAEDGGEIGAWHFLQRQAREHALLLSLDEFLRFGLEAGLIYVN